MTPQAELYTREVRAAHDDDLPGMLAGWKSDSEFYLIVRTEIDRRKQDVRDRREDDRVRKSEFRSWLSVGISVLALAVALGVALYK